MKGNEKSKGGRPEKFTRPEIQERVLKAIACGATRPAAAGFAGICEDTFYKMLNVVPGFSESVKIAEMKAVARFQLKVTKAAQEGNWTAAAWWLERRHPNDYAKREPEIAAQNNTIRIVVLYGDQQEAKTIDIPSNGNGHKALPERIGQIQVQRG